MARAWKQAAIDLGIDFISPYRFQGNDGNPHLCTGLVVHFGSPRGTPIVSATDPEFDILHEVMSDLGFHETALNPRHYGVYDRAHFLKTLRDWRYYGPPDRRPAWYVGE